MRTELACLKKKFLSTVKGQSVFKQSCDENNRLPRNRLSTQGQKAVTFMLAQRSETSVFPQGNSIESAMSRDDLPA